MNALFRRPDVIPISLGYSCHVKVFCDMMSEMDGGIGTARYPFDWAGTPMWSVNEIVECDFADLLDRSAIKPRPRYMKDTTKFLTHDRYNVVYLHDFGKDITNIREEMWKKAEDGYARRVERWNGALGSGHSVLFIRLEQDKKDRIEYPEFVRERGSDELYQVQRFAETMKSRGVNCMILFLSTTHPTGFDAERKVCTVQFAKKDPSTIVGGDHIDKIVQANLAHIRNCMAVLPFPLVPRQQKQQQQQQQIVTI